MKKTLWAIAATLLSLVNTASADLIRVHEVAPGIFRGSRPENEADIQEMKAMGIKTIYNLVTTRADIDWENKAGTKAGMKVVSVPINPMIGPSTHTINLLLSEIQNPENQPIYLHCRHGKDRTGLIFGIFRVEVQDWSAEQAYSEMREIGFNPILVGLDYAFWHRMHEDGKISWVPEMPELNPSLVPALSADN